jgi:simple sugar transport system ATP-binding protein
MVHQHFTIVPAMTVAENVALAVRAPYQRRRADHVVREIGERTGLALDPSVTARDLTLPAQQRLEILKALAGEAKLLIMDEPTAVLAPSEGEELLAWTKCSRWPIAFSSCAREWCGRSRGTASWWDGR